LEKKIVKKTKIKITAFKINKNGNKKLSANFFQLFHKKINKNKNYKNFKNNHLVNK